MTDHTGNVVNWFDIPVTDLDRAMRFYGEVVGLPLQRYETEGIAGALFPAEGVTGTLLLGDGFTPSHQGSVVYLNPGPDLNHMLERVEHAGGKILLPKTPIPGDRGFLPTLRTPRETASVCIRRPNAADEALAIPWPAAASACC